MSATTDTAVESGSAVIRDRHRGRQRGWSASRWAFAGAALVVLGVLFAALYGQASVYPVDSDGAGNALQAWDMLHGNILLHGWVLSDVSFYTTELPEYMLVETLFGLGPHTVAISAALTYTLIVGLGVFAAVGRTTGRERWIRAAVTAAAIMAPSAGPGTHLLLASPDHIGTAVPLLVAFIVLDRLDGRRWMPWLLTAVLAWGIVGDPLVEVAGALPIAVVAAVRALKDPVGRRREVWTAVAAVASVPLGMEVLKTVHALGGFVVFPPPLTFIALTDLPAHAAMTLESVLDVSSANFSGLTPGLKLAVAGYHLLFVAAAAVAAHRCLRRFAILDSRMNQALAAGICTVLLAYMLTSMSDGTDTYTAREVTAVMPLGAVLLARVAVGPALAWLAARSASRLAPLVAAGLLAASSGLLAVHATDRAEPSKEQAAVDWLTKHNLTSGLAGYWQAASITALSHGRIASRSVNQDGSYIAKRFWESKADWYSSSESSANFMIIDTVPGDDAYVGIDGALNTFGKPAQRVDLPGRTILVWDYDILERLH